MADSFQHQVFQDEDPQNNLDFNITMEDNSTRKNAAQPSEQHSASKEQTQLKQVEPLPDYAKNINAPQEVSYLSQAAHPGMCILTMVFKAISIGTFLLTTLVLDWFNANKTFPFVIIVLSAAFDFWSVKNLTGRYLVKLRWWSEIQENGTEKWQFESFEDGIAPNDVDSTFFWFSQFSAGCFWAIIIFLNVISLNLFYSTLSIINFILISGNFVGYYKCRGAHQKKMKSAISKLGMKMISDAI